LRHSTVSITADTYSHVSPALDLAAPEQVASYVDPRLDRCGTVVGRPSPRDVHGSGLGRG
jgi:hypothetical protein